MALDGKVDQEDISNILRIGGLDLGSLICEGACEARRAGMESNQEKSDKIWRQIEKIYVPAIKSIITSEPEKSRDIRYAVAGSFYGQLLYYLKSYDSSDRDFGAFVVLCSIRDDWKIWCPLAYSIIINTIKKMADQNRFDLQNKFRASFVLAELDKKRILELSEFPRETILKNLTEAIEDEKFREIAQSYVDYYSGKR